MTRSAYEGFDLNNPISTYQALPDSPLAQCLRELMHEPYLASMVSTLARAHADDKFETASQAKEKMAILLAQLLMEKRIGELLNPNIEENVQKIRRVEDIALRIAHLFPGEPKTPDECEESAVARIMMNLRKHFEKAVFVCMRWSLKKRGLLTPANLCRWNAENAETYEAQALRMIIEFGGA